MLKKEGNMARRWFLIDEKVRFVIAGIVEPKEEEKKKHGTKKKKNSD